MKSDYQVARSILVPALVGLLLVGGCATRPQSAAGFYHPVRSVRFRGTPELPSLAQHAQEVGDRLYPEICALLSDENDTPPRHFEVIFKPLKSDNLGLADVMRDRIYIESSRFTNGPAAFDNFDKVFVHEMAHIAAQYQHWAMPFWDSRSPAEKYWSESIADYARFKILGTNGWQCPECNSRFPSYMDGYACGGAFLLFLENRYGTSFIRRLVTQLRTGRYAETLFQTSTGKDLDRLWAEFETTSAFRPGARETLKIRKALGYRTGRPPRHVVKRFEEYVAQHQQAAFTNGFRLQFETGHPPSIEVLIQTYIYNTQPGGPGELTIEKLYKEGRLPGFSKGEKALPMVVSDSEELEIQDFPKTRTVKLLKKSDSSIYLYHLACPSLESGWKLEQATRVSADGTNRDELPVE